MKPLPNGEMLAFPTASAALAWAGHELGGPSGSGVAIGVSAGDVVVAEDDRFGLTVVEAARLCNDAELGSGLATQPAAVVAGDAGTGDTGPRQLKGLGSVDAVAIAETGSRLGDDAPQPVMRRMGAILTTDLVGSTGLVAPLSREEAEAVRRSHFGILRDVGGRHDGREIANLGDGLVVEFPSVTAALDAAVAMHRNLLRHNRRADVELLVRISIAAGELTGDDHWDEPPIARSMALQSVADSSEIVVDALALRLASDRVREADGGRVESDDANARLVPWSPVHLVPLQPQLAAEHRVHFSGRIEELARFDKAWRAVVAGESQAIFVSGEAGIGKSRLTKEFALRAFESGGVALYGRCDEDLSVPYQPFGEAFAHLVGHLPENVLIDYLDQHGGALVKLVPGLRQRIEVEVGEPTPGIDERLALFEAISGLLTTVAAIEPTLLVLEDLHWADPGTALLLKHLARSIRGVPLMIVGNFRDVAADDLHPLAKTLADLRREHWTQRVELTGLDGGEVVEMLAAAAGHELDADAMSLADRIHRECGGSPFMVNEILLHLIDTGGLVYADGRWNVVSTGPVLNIPASVREVISQRIARLGDTTQAVLRTAAVIGLAFDYKVLVAASSEDEDDVLDALDAGVGAALLWDPSDFDGRFSFGHAVFQKTLYEELGPTRRARIHRRVAEHLEAAGGARPAELARHWSAAGVVGDQDKIRRYSKLAGDAAMAELAYEDAVRHYQVALDAVAPDDEEARLDLLLDLGAAQRAAGVAEFTPTLRNAAAIAHHLGDAERVARAALGASLAGTWRAAAGTEMTELVELLRGALHDVGDTRPELRARLLAQLAAESYWNSKRDYTRTLLDEALALAREHGDARTLAEVIATRLRCLNDPDTLTERLAMSTELIELVEPLGELALKLHAAMYRGVAVFEAGQLEEWKQRLGECEKLAAQAKQPFLAWRVAYMQTMVEAMKDPARGEASAEATYAIGAPLDDEDVFTLYATTLFVVRLEQGRAAELLPTLRQLDAERAGIPVWRAVLGLALSEAGELDEARSVVRDAILERRSHAERDHVWWGTVIVLAETVTSLRDADLAAVILAEVEPFVDHITCVGLGTASTGAAARTVAQMEWLLGRYDDADRHFVQAHEMNERFEANCFGLRGRHDHIAMLLERDRPGDRQRAADMLEGAEDRARELGMLQFIEQFRSLSARLAA